jgi:hypothetical protein
LFLSPEDPLKIALCTEVRGSVTHSISDRSEYRLNQVNVIGTYIVEIQNEYLLILYDNRATVPPVRRQAAAATPTLATTFKKNGSSRESETSEPVPEPGGSTHLNVRANR